MNTPPSKPEKWSTFIDYISMHVLCLDRADLTIQERTHSGLHVISVACRLLAELQSKDLSIQVNFKTDTQPAVL